MASEKSKILIIGGTGYIGKFIVEASAKANHPTFLLVRESTVNDPAKGALIQNFKNLGVTLLYGDLYDHESLVKAIKQVDVVISTVGNFQLADQTKIIAAIKEAGNVERFFPSEFGNDVDRVHAVEPAKSAFAIKAQIRRAIEAEGIPYTYVSSNCFAGYFLPTLVQLGATSPPRDKVTILGDGNPKAIFNKEDDIGTYTIRAVDDPRTLNKVLYLKPPKNIYTFNELVALWEKKIGKVLEKVYVPEDKLLNDILEAPIPINVILAINHSVFVKGDHTNFEIEPSFGVEASELYPDVKYTTVEEALEHNSGKEELPDIYSLRATCLQIAMADLQKSKILVIGGTGYIGKFIVEASAKANHPTFALVRETTVNDPAKGKLIQKFKNLGVTLLYGDINDHESLVKVIKQVDVVISTVGGPPLQDQTKIISAIKEAGNIKRFFPSEFGSDVDRVHDIVEPAKSFFESKVQIRRAIEAEGIPHTYVTSNCFAGYFLPRLAQPDVTSPPRDKVIIFGDGNAKAIFVDEEDIGTYTIRAVDDPRTLNKVLHLRPPRNIYSFNELVALWEKKIGKPLEKVYHPEQKLLDDSKATPFPENVILGINHSVFVKGFLTNFEIEPSIGVEAFELYPDVEYTTVEDYLDQFV
ncbi:hypothetical protein ACLB2K_015296 [Fragaria x ananassa]